MTSAGSVGDDERLRLFLALELPSSTLDELEAWSSANLSGGRVVPREHLHVTLAFLGRRRAGDVAAIVGALREAVAAASEAIALEAVRWRETRSVGMLVLADHGGVATRLAARLHPRLEALGVYRPEARPWLPHVTMLRFRARPRLSPPLPRTGTFVPSDAAAYLSRLHPAGARYEVLERVSLIAGG
jgi:RNA 2',3'-cyclic 3'-phosphodiesterase